MKATGLVLDAERSVDVEPGVVTLYDMSRFGNDGAMDNITWTQLPSGLWVMSLNGTNSGVRIASGQLYRTTTTLECWIRLNNATQVDKAIMGQLSPFFWDQYGSGILFDNGVLSVISESNHDKAALTVALTDIISWHHVVGIVRTASGKLFLDGVEVDSGDLDSGYLYWFAIGASRDDTDPLAGNYFDGLISGVRVYNYALSAGQILKKYEATRRFFGV